MCQVARFSRVQTVSGPFPASAPNRNWLELPAWNRFRRHPRGFAALGRGLGLAAGLAVILVGLMLGNHTVSDQDLFLHDLAGRRILAGDGIPRQNEFSFTAPEHPWVDHEWFFQVVVALAGDAGGEHLADRATAWHALSLLLTAVLLGALLLGDGVAQRVRRGVTPSPWPMLAALLALAMLWTRLQLRPELVSMVFFVVVLRQVEAAYRPRRDGAPATTGWRDLADPRRAAGRATWTTVAWAQVHGFYLLGAAIWLAVGLTGSHDRRLHPGARALALGGAVAAVLAGLLTPNHVDGLLYPLRVLGQFTGGGPDLRETISELVPLLRSPDGLHLTILAYLVSLAWGAAWVIATWGCVPRGRIVLWLVAALAAWQGQRNLGLYAIAFLLLHTGLRPGETWLARRWGRQRQKWSPAAGVVVALLVLVLGTVWARDIASSRFYLREGEARRWGRGLTPANFPLRQAAALPGGLRLANNIDAASTLLRLGAGKVCIDGRTEAYPPAAWREYAIVKAGGDDALAMLGRWQVQHVVLAHRNQASHPLLRTLLRSPAWSLADADDAGVHFVPAAAGAAAPNAVVLRARRRRVRRAIARGRTPRRARRRPLRGVGRPAEPRGRGRTGARTSGARANPQPRPPGRAAQPRQPAPGRAGFPGGRRAVPAGGGLEPARGGILAQRGGLRIQAGTARRGGQVDRARHADLAALVRGLGQPGGGPPRRWGPGGCSSRLREGPGATRRSPSARQRPPRFVDRRLSR